MNNLTKICSKCNIEKNRLTDFYPRNDRNSVMSYCKECAKQNAKIKTPQERERKKQYDLEYNRTKRVIKRNLEKERIASKKYRIKNKQKINEKEKEKYRNDIQFNLTKKLRIRVAK